ncbi:IclR family transcriptional regulator [Natronomonas marina]|jgi:IclR family acetate operon transcriptional repressor|uniref:IclR family transcriptional regulator n=1 Tax=Natronomonas marina TaxID=2961939 RepID=UPI0020C9B7D6|nr:IclR family transcriptional regulator [Natronomonas marina]
MGDENGPGRTVATLRTAFTILDSVVAIDGGTVTEIADDAGLAKSTVHAHLQTLRENDYVVKTGTRYHIGLGFLDLGFHARNRTEGFSLIRRKAEILAEETGELVVFIVEENGRGVVLLRERGVNAVESAVRTGNGVPLHATAAGKAIMAHWPVERVESTLERVGLPEQTDRTITNEERLYQELEEIRERGYAVSSGEHTAGLETLSAPVVGTENTIIGGLSVSGPTSRLQNPEHREQLTTQLLGATNELELKIRYS